MNLSAFIWRRHEFRLFRLCSFKNVHIKICRKKEKKEDIFIMETRTKESKVVENNIIHIRRRKYRFTFIIICCTV